MRRKSLVVLAVFASFASVARLNAQTDSSQHSRGGVHVLVRDAAANSSLWGAEVELPMLEVTFAVPDNGDLLINHVPTGTYVLRVSRIGYTMQTKIVTVHADTPSVHFALDRAAIPLEAVNVVAPENAGIRDFEARLRAGNGKFFTANDIEKTGARLLTQFLETVHGVKLQPTGGAYSERAPMGASGMCPSGVLVFLDGVPVNALEDTDPSRAFRSTPTIAVPRTTSAAPASSGSSGTPSVPRAGVTAAAAAAAQANTVPNPIRNSAALPPFDINSISLSQIGAMEVYPDGAPSQMPYGGGSRCGVVLLWSKAKK